MSKRRTGYRSRESYHAKSPEAKARQIAGLGSDHSKAARRAKQKKLREDDLRYKVTDIKSFVEREFYIPETRKPIQLLPYETRFLDRIYRKAVKPTLACLGTPKKCGKSTIAAMIALFELVSKSDAEIYIVGPDLEQSQLVVFSKIRKAIRMSKYLQKFLSSQTSQIINKKNDSFIRPLACSSTNAGLNSTLNIFDELWRFTSDEALQTYEELTNIPKKDNMNLIVTYAGFAEDEDSILYRLYQDGIAQQEGRAEKDKQFLFRWYGEELYEQIPWVTKNYLTMQKKRLRPNTFARFHQNLWSAGTESFITTDILDSCTHSHKKGMTFTGQVVIGVDIGLKHDCSAIAVVGKVDSKNLILIDHKLFIPDAKRHRTIDLESTVEAALLDYRKKYKVRQVLYDPYQFQRSAAQLRQSRLKMVEFPQTQSNTCEMSENLSDLLCNQKLMLYQDKEIRLHLLNAQIKETPRGHRIVKRKQSKKIDLTIALAEACFGATESFLLSSGRSRVHIPGRDVSDDNFIGEFMKERAAIYAGRACALSG